MDQSSAGRWRADAVASGVTPGRPCTLEELDAAERSLGRAIPADLRSLYEAADGFFDQAGQWFVVWPLERLVSDNVRSWSEGRLRRDLLAFGDDGTGNPFCVPTNEARPREVIRWSWIDDDVEDAVATQEFFSIWTTLRAFPPKRDE